MGGEQPRSCASQPASCPLYAIFPWSIPGSHAASPMGSFAPAHAALACSMLTRYRSLSASCIWSVLCLAGAIDPTTRHSSTDKPVHRTHNAQCRSSIHEIHALERRPSPLLTHLPVRAAHRTRASAPQHSLCMSGTDSMRLSTCAVKSPCPPGAGLQLQRDVSCRVGGRQ